jgi:hypothetical protein
MEHYSSHKGAVTVWLIIHYTNKPETNLQLQLCQPTLEFLEKDDTVQDKIGVPLKISAKGIRRHLEGFSECVKFRAKGPKGWVGELLRCIVDLSCRLM